MSAPHDERDGEAVDIFHDLHHIGAQLRECCMQGSSSGDKINERQICAVDSHRIGIELGEPIFQPN
jgi:hypothetical protein